MPQSCDWANDGRLTQLKRGFLHVEAEECPTYRIARKVAFKPFSTSKMQVSVNQFLIYDIRGNHVFLFLCKKR